MNYVKIENIIKNNTARILSLCSVQPRYKPEKETQEKPNKENVGEKPNEHVKSNDFNKRFLFAVYNGQYKKTLTEICKNADFSAGTGSRISEENVKSNNIKNIQVPFVRGRPKFPVLLPEGYKVIGIEEKKILGRGAGYEHTLYQHLIATHFQNYKPIIELNRNEKFIDVAIETNEILIAIEVAMTSVHEKENIEKDYYLAKADFVFIACINEKIKKEVQNIVLQLNENIRNKTEIWLISELLKKNPDELINSHQLKIHF